MLNKITLIFSYVYVLLCSLLMTLFAQSNPFQLSFVGDTAVFIYIAKEIMEGGMPYRDFFDHKGPLIYLFDALGLLIDDRVGIWIVELTIIFITFLFAYKIARLLKCSRFSSCVVVTIGIFALLYYFQGGNLTEEYACAFITVSFYYFLAFLITGKINKLQVVLTGASFAAVCMLRANMIACWLVMISAFLFDCFIRKKYQFAVHLICWFAVGALLLFIPTFVWLFINDAFQPFINDYICFNIIYSSETLVSSKLSALFMFITSPSLILSIPVLFYFCVKHKRREDWLCMMALLLSVILASMAGRKHGHYGMIFYPFVIYVASRLFYEYSTTITAIKTKASFFAKKRIVAGAFLFCFVSCIIFPIMSVFITGNLVALIYPLKDIDFKKNRRIADIISSVTDNDDKISVVGNDNSLYLLSNRKSVSKYSYQFPIADTNYAIWEDYLNDIQKLTAKIIVLPPGADQAHPYCEIKLITDKYYRLISVVDRTEIYLLKTK